MTVQSQCAPRLVRARGVPDCDNAQTHPRPPGWGQNVKPFFMQVVMLHIKLKRIEHRAP